LRKNRVGDSGMETPASMFLLMASSMLIIGILNGLADEGGDESGLLRLRHYQVNSMGSTLVSWDPTGSGETLLTGVSRTGEDTVYIWNGSDMTVPAGKVSDLDPLIMEFLSSSPDGLPCILLVDVNDQNEIGTGGSFVTWAHVIPGKAEILLFLPLERGSLTFDGMVLR